MIYVGTSGYNYPEWKGSFYPSDLPAAKMLPYYAERFSTVEINYTFYRMPTAKLVTGWAAQVPADFRFTLKAPRRITHDKRLREAETEVTEFMRRASAMGDSMGIVLFQLPPYLRKDAPLLSDFLGILPSDRRTAFEFRHASWHDDEVYALLRAHGAALCAADTDEEEAAFVPTAETFGYLRLRRTNYDDKALRRWIERIRMQRFESVFVYFKHEDEALGPRFAQRFRELWDGGSA